MQFDDQHNSNGDVFGIAQETNQYIEDLSQIPSQDQQEYSNELDQYQIQRDDDHDSNDDVFGEPDLMELQIRGRRGRIKKNKCRGKTQSQTQPLLTTMCCKRVKIVNA
ncbi:MAG: hypothetical protein EZS28_055222 [Streblomastix strix]|uniref:Uncharacterized protein n=1 Tax=Streblomastix strix TaxID=222440 RepID=A0A5J4Q457_9EUKA|nr:MAG: hypothetical protein EZS28_055222 [Streblomastix strix]